MMARPINPETGETLSHEEMNVVFAFVPTGAEGLVERLKALRKEIVFATVYYRRTQRAAAARGVVNLAKRMASLEAEAEAAGIIFGYLWAGSRVT